MIRIAAITTQVPAASTSSARGSSARDATTPASLSSQTAEVPMDRRGAPAMANARAALGSLADRASSVHAASDYERVLLTLDAYTGDASPSASDDDVDDPHTAIAGARRSLLALEGVQLTSLQVEILLAMLDEALAGDLG